MLICFAVSWPAALYKSWTSRTSKGKSLLFLCFILLGYLSGIAKIIVQDGFFTFLVIPYTFNFFLIFADLILYFRNLRFDKMRGKNQVC